MIKSLLDIILFVLLTILLAFSILFDAVGMKKLLAMMRNGADLGPFVFLLLLKVLLHTICLSVWLFCSRALKDSLKAKRKIGKARS